MNFTKKKIKPEIIWIIDIWTYKSRTAITKYHNKELELIWYWEKRQDFLNNYKENLSWIIKNIEDSIVKAEKNWNIKIKNIVLNIPFEEVFFEVTKINYIRKDTSKKIDDEELLEILKEMKKSSLKKAYNNIKNNYSYNKEQLKLIICNINKILIDKVKTKKIVWTNPIEINISMLNIFIPEENYKYIKKIWSDLNKKILKIIPSEYSIAKLDYNNKKVVIIDLWSCHTSVIVKKHDNIIWIKKISVWIRDLIIEISKKYLITRAYVIDTIDENDLYINEKNKFLEIFQDVLIIALEEILWTNSCPSNFFMIGWWSNKFIKNYVSKIDLAKAWINIDKKIKFITPNIEYLDDIDSSKSNLNIFSIMNSTIDFIKRQKDEIEDTLKMINEE